LEPYIGEKTLHIHHDKHHARYVTVANDLIKGTDMEMDDVVTIIRKAHQNKNQALFNNAGQSFNHDFYWKSMKPNGGGLPSDERLMKMIEESFGNFDNFRQQFTNAANTVFGSGWAWLVYTPNGLKVSKQRTPCLLAH
jgi:Fe-Mn family superoxide dismutase